MRLKPAILSDVYPLRPETGARTNEYGGKPATAFLFNLISRLQFGGTVPNDRRAVLQPLAVDVIQVPSAQVLLAVSRSGHSAN